MADSWSHDNDSEQRLKLRREARFPIRGGRRPCWMMGALMATVVVATYLDSVAWQRRVEQVELRAQARAAEAQAARLQQEVRALAEELESVQEQLCAYEDSAAHVRIESSVPSMAPLRLDGPMPRAMAPVGCGAPVYRPAGLMVQRDLR